MRTAHSQMLFERPCFRNSPKPWGAVVALLIGILPLGCGQSSEATVQGMVTFEGKPLSSGMVTFHPAGGVGAQSFSPIQANGNYDIHTGKHHGLVAGPYIVTVVAREPITPELAASMGMPKAITPARYSDPATSDLRCTVNPGSNRLDFGLKP